MKTVSTPGLDISEMVQQSRAAVGGKSPIEALNSLASQNHTDVRELRKSAQENLKRFPFVALTSQTILSEDGRVAAKSPGILKFGSSDKPTLLFTLRILMTWPWPAVPARAGLSIS